MGHQCRAQSLTPIINSGTAGRQAGAHFAFLHESLRFAAILVECRREFG